MTEQIFYLFYPIKNFVSIKDILIMLKIMILNLLKEFIFLILTSVTLSFVFIFFFKKRIKIYGRDIHKKECLFIPEAMGISTGLSFSLTLMIHLIFKLFNHAITLDSFNNYIATLFSCIFTLLLGFLDDVFDLKWGFKIICPGISIIPCIVLYNGRTDVLLPLIGLVDIGIFYYIYMILFSIFSTNSINILSGINGLEVLQVIIISFFLFCDNFIKLYQNWLVTKLLDLDSVFFYGMVISLLLFSSSLPLYIYNKFPASVFVGDTYCYFSGMCLSCVAIICHTTRTLFFISIVQVLNFIISLPQILPIFPCPRHRLPGFDGEFIVPSYFKWKNKKIINFTLLNLILKLKGPLKEKTLCWIVGYIMIFFGGLVLIIKHKLLD